MDSTIFTIRNLDGSSIELDLEQSKALAVMAQQLIKNDLSIIKKVLGDWSGTENQKGPVPVENVGEVWWNENLDQVDVIGVLLPAQTAAELVAVGVWSYIH